MLSSHYTEIRADMRTYISISVIRCNYVAVLPVILVKIWNNRLADTTDFSSLHKFCYYKLLSKILHV